MDQKLVGVAVVALIVGAGVGYGGAHVLAKPPASRAAFAQNGGSFRSGGTFTRGGPAGTAGAGFLTGTIAKTGSGSLTLNTRDGSSHVVLITPSTTVSKSVDGSLSDISVGDTVMVSGTPSPDGSLSASLIQLRPAGTAGAPMMPATQ